MNTVYKNIIGILGGTFDPIHNAHLNIAKACLKLKLNKIIFLPNGKPYYNLKQPTVSAIHRLNMVKLAIKFHDNSTMMQ